MISNKQFDRNTHVAIFFFFYVFELTQCGSNGWSVEPVDSCFGRKA